MTQQATKQKVRFKWTPSDNSNIAFFHVDIRLLQVGEHSTGGDLTTELQELYDSLDNLHGVNKVVITRYMVIIDRGLCFSWEEIMPKVESAFSEWCGATLVPIP